MTVSVNSSKPKQMSGLPGFLQGIVGFNGDVYSALAKANPFSAPNTARLAAWATGASPKEYVPPALGGPDTNARSNGSRGVGHAPMPSDPAQAVETPEDRLRRILGYSSQFGMNSGGVDYTGLMDTLKNTAGQNDARTQAMYAQLQNQIGADAGALGQIYDNTGAAINQNADKASGNTSAAAQASTDMLTKQLADLGIGAAAGTSGGSVAGDAAQAIANIEQNRAANTNQNTSHKGTALAYNSARKDLAGFTANETRGKIQSALAEKLASIGLQQAQSQQSSQSGNLDMGLKIDSLLHPVDPNSTPQAQQALAKFIADQQSTAFKQNSTQADAQRAIWQLVFKQTGDQAQADAAVARLSGQGMGFGG